MSKIKNRDQLLNSGVRESREKILHLLERMWEEVDAYSVIKKLMRLEEDVLHIGKRSWDLKAKRNIYLFGAGKACNAMAMALGEVLGDRLTRGVISVKIAEPQDRYVNTEVYVGGHPLPNKEGLLAADAILEMIGEAGPDDLFFSVISGGSSALLTCPVDGITLEDEICAQDMLLRSGAKILEINAVRRHISRTNGGRLAQQVCARGAELINIIVGDSVGARPTKDNTVPATFFGTPVAPDKTTVKDALDSIYNYNLQDKMPKAIMEFLSSGKDIETPKEFSDKVTHFVLNDVPDSCEAALKAAKEMGVPAMIYSTFLEGESCEAGTFFAALAREIQANGRPIKAPCFIFCSGESTTKVEDGADGKGGPSHEMALGFAMGARHTDGAALVSVDTEGTDGTTGAAGAIADSTTFAELERQGLNLFDVLRRHDSGTALETLGDSIFTGNTGTNLCDFNVLYVPAAED